MVGHRDEAAEQRPTGTGSGAVLMARTAPVGRNVPLQRKSSARHGRAPMERRARYELPSLTRVTPITDLGVILRDLLVLCDCG